MIVLDALLTLIEAAIDAAGTVLAGLARLLARGMVAGVLAVCERLQRRRLVRGPDNRAARLLGPLVAQRRRILIVAYSALFGMVLEGPGWPARGALVGAGCALVPLVLAAHGRRLRLGRRRRPLEQRLYHVALASFPIPPEQHRDWWLIVRRWTLWPLREPEPGELTTWLGRRHYAATVRKAARPTMPALVRFRLPSEFHPEQLHRDRFAAALREATGLDWSLRWDMPNHAVWAEAVTMPEQAPYPIGWPALEHRYTIPLAVRHAGELVCWQADRDPMGAMAGRTGSGKTIAAGALVIGTGRAGWDDYLVDGKMTSLGIFRGRRGVRMVGLEPDGPEGWWAVIEAVYGELQDRKRTLARGGSIAGRPPVLLLIDELPIVVALERGKGPEIKARNHPRLEAARKLTEIASQGRSLDVHYWPTAQALAAAAVEGPQKVNLSALLVFRTTGTGSYQAMESTAAAMLPKIAGRAVWTDATDDAAEVQVLTWAPGDPAAPHDLDDLLPVELGPARPARPLQAVPDDASAILG